MRNTFYLFLLLISLLFTACSDEKEIKNPTNPPSEKQEVIPPKTHSFQFKNTNDEILNFEVKGNNYHFTSIKQSIVLVNFFATWCPPCRGLMPHLNNLKKKYNEEFFILGILLHDEIESEHLNTFAASQKVKYYISNNTSANQVFANFISPKLRLPKEFKLPLMIMFVNGQYYTHYEGVVPEEMIESDIKQALNKAKGF